MLTWNCICFNFYFFILQEKVGIGVVMVAGVIAFPAYVLANLLNYRARPGDE